MSAGVGLRSARSLDFKKVQASAGRLTTRNVLYLLNELQYRLIRRTSQGLPDQWKIERPRKRERSVEIEKNRFDLVAIHLHGSDPL